MDKGFHIATITYSYVANNPVSRIDVLGLRSLYFIVGYDASLMVQNEKEYNLFKGDIKWARNYCLNSVAPPQALLQQEGVIVTPATITRENMQKIRLVFELHDKNLWIQPSIASKYWGYHRGRQQPRFNPNDTLMLSGTVDWLKTAAQHKPANVVVGPGMNYNAIGVILTNRRIRNPFRIGFAGGLGSVKTVGGQYQRGVFFNETFLVQYTKGTVKGLGAHELGHNMGWLDFETNDPHSKDLRNLMYGGRRKPSD